MTIAITEIENDDFADVFFKLIQNFELNIALTKDVNEERANRYFKGLRDKITFEKMQWIEFSQYNKFFHSALTLGFDVHDMNKFMSGYFNYKLPLKQNVTEREPINLI